MSGGDWKDLFGAACAGDLELVRFHLRAGVDPDHVHPEFQCTVLVSCILAGQEAAAGLLLDHGASPTHWSELDDATPLEAARRMHMDVLARRLAALGALDVAPAEHAAAAPSRQWWRRR